MRVPGPGYGPGMTAIGTASELGRPTSLWVDTDPGERHPRLDGEHTADVCVVGGGITGVTTALLAARSGAKVILVEADDIAGGATGFTTAKVTSQHGTIYSDLTARHGEDVARTYGAAQEWAIERIARFVDEDALDCDWRRRDHYVFAFDDQQREQIEEEARAAARAGLPAGLVEHPPLPFETRGAVRFTGQAEFHPCRYVHGLVRRLQAAGGEVYERSRAQAVRDGDAPHVITERGMVYAQHVVVTTGMPFVDRSAAWARAFPYRSYLMSARIEGSPPDGMFISAGSPTRSLRDHDGLLLVGGEGHHVGEGRPTIEHYRALAEWARRNFQVQSFEHRWSTQDYMPADRLPLIGRANPLAKRVWIATGFQKWGMTNGTVAAAILAEAVQGREHEWARTFDPNRLQRGGLTKLVTENARVAAHFVGDRLRRGIPEADELTPGEGAIARLDGQRKACFRDDDGTLHAVSPTCTHLGCEVRFNDAERSWDCPCHGSRFDPDGRVLEGPATTPLDREPVR
jgi:glycine/D-amino acid oxidase-like deaminating enzyme/nitrite reductase/ring-hydroxylating ferredoxin subunit